MYFIHENSFDSELPIYQKLVKNEKNCMFIPEARVAKDYFLRCFYERGHLNWACKTFCDKTKNVIDIGAHIGWYTIDLARHSNHVYAFECSPKSFNYLCANIALNECDYKVDKYNVALDSKESTTKYYIRDPKDGGGNGISKFEYDDINNVQTIDVPTKTLDSFNLDNINFIKIDVEGHELQVLEGGLETIRRNNFPKILFESWDEKPNFPSVELRKNLFSFLTNIGYNKITNCGQELYLAEKVVN